MIDWLKRIFRNFHIHEPKYPEYRWKFFDKYPEHQWKEIRRMPVFPEVVCERCGMELEGYARNSLLFSNRRRELNDQNPCLTEEEFVIKNVIT